MKQWLPAAVCALGLGSTTAMAAADTVGLGNGHNGPLTVSTSGTVINSYAQVTAAVAAQATSIQIGTCRGDAACFAAGDLVLVYQATGIEPTPVSGAQNTIDLSNSPVGQWEFARLASATAARLELTEPLIYGYASNVTQVIRVPEYTDVTIDIGQSITAPAWNGATGGVIAFLATNVVNNRGTINADALGFRGGQYAKGDLADRGCTDLDDAAPRGAQKGEGIGAGRYGATQTGRGNVTNGAGGAVCYRSGGGGGGNGGDGGQGGFSDLTDGSRSVGGMGGTALSHGNKTTSDTYLRRLTFGGGGGAGHGTAVTSPGGTGGAGGGIVFLRAGQLQGSTGVISAAGEQGGLTFTSIEGGGGGGAGGTIYVRIVRSAICGQILATGGIGATSSSPRVGPGGGGSAGHVLLQALSGGSCSTNAILATGANPGTQQNPGDGSYGATAGGPIAGKPSPINELTYGFIIPAPPVVTTPANGSFINNVRPPLSGTARPNTPVIVYLDGQEVGRVTTDAAGNYSVTPTQDLSEGPHSVVAIAAIDAVQSLNSVPDTFTVDITPPDTNFVTQPGRFTRARDVTFEFGSPEESVTYLCKLDDAADFVPCPASRTFTNLPDGPHKVEVYSVDRAGNRDESPAVHEFQITVADLSLLGDGIGGCSATGQDASLIALGLGALVAGLRRRRQSQTH